MTSIDQDGASAGHAGASLLLLADGRFPAGGYAHSGGLEPLVRSGAIKDAETLERFLDGRAHTVGLVSAAFAAAACRAVWTNAVARLTDLDEELDARMPSPAARATSRQLGRQFLRVMQAIAFRPVLAHLGSRPHQPLALGVSCAVLGRSPHDAALASLHESVAGPAAAAVRLLSLDPFAVHTLLASLTPALDDLADEADLASAGDVDDLPAAAASMLDVAAERHAHSSSRLFAS
ncbi:MAG: urease accessory protein UreF [Actinomycetes bacterium]